jgi:hypothetical protein
MDRRDTLLYALGVGAPRPDLAFTTEAATTPAAVLPYAVIACLPFAAAGKIGSFNFPCCYTDPGSGCSPLPPTGKLSVVAGSSTSG